MADTDLDLVLRSPGSLLLLQRPAAQGLVDRLLAGAPERRAQPSLLKRAMTAIGRRVRAMEDDDDEGGVQIDRTKLAMPYVPWAKTIEFGDGYAVVDGVAIIDIRGVLTPEGYIDWWSWEWVGGYAQIEVAIEAARADDRVHAIFLRVYSPGGMVDGCFDLAESIRAGNAKAGGKPVWVHARMACSAAYALASGADRILAPAEGDVGSIGVLIVHWDITGWLAEVGIKIEAIQSGPRKTDGAEWKPLTEDARAHLQGVVDQVARRFVGVVSAGRGLEADAIRAQEARWFLAQHDDETQSGLALGLVDEIASERAAFTALVQSLTAETGTGAPASSGSNAAKAARAEETETEMELAAQIAALRDKAKNGDAAAIAELKTLGVSLEAPADEPADEEEETDKDKDKDGDKEPEASATGSEAGFAVVGSTEAKGREKLAAELGKKVAAGKMTYGEALKMLAAAPKGSRLAESMSGKDRNPGTSGENKAGAALGAAVDRLNAKRKTG